MLGRLMKYEFKATGRIFLPLFAALLIILLVTSLFAGSGFTAFTAISFSITMLVSFATGVAMIIITLQRFYRNLLGSEGYLMFTLPVSIDALILSKLIVTTVWFLLYAVIGQVIIFVSFRSIFNSMETGMFDITAIYQGIFQHIPYIEIILYVIAAIFAIMLMIYASMSIGMLANRNRGLASFGAFIGIWILMQIISTIFITVLGTALGGFDNIPALFYSIEDYPALDVALFFGIVGQLVVGIIFYGVTRYLLMNKLNLE